MGRTVAFDNIDWGSLCGNLSKAHRWWMVVSKVLNKMGYTMRAWAKMYKVVVQLVIL